MSDDSLHRAEELFHRLVDLPPEEQQQQLDEACGSDDRLRAQVKALLGPVSPAVDSLLDSRTVKIPDAIGPYRILRKVGEGGMAIVYLAEQAEPVRRRVALKVIKPGLDSGQVLQRFEAERQALAVMDHPNVAKVFDAGTTIDGRPYFVLEYVDGHTITEHCDLNRLKIEQRLNLFLQVCQAVQHAHQKGVIHRDLKPSNILVSSDPSVSGLKVIDFGVAKAVGLVDEPMFTSYGQLLGTPEYMSPEQAGATGDDVDTRADVYSLGVVLYELLVGSLPFESARLRREGVAEMLRVIREEDPLIPSVAAQRLDDRLPGVCRNRQIHPASLARRLRRDLDWIVARALEKDRNRRYGSPHEMALDITRHLSDEPVLAGPPTTRYRFQKFLRRNRAGTVAAALTLVAMIAATVTSVGFALSEREQRRIASRSVIEAGQRAEEAAKALARLEPVVGFQKAMLLNLDIELMGKNLFEQVRTGIREGLQEIGEEPGAIEEALDTYDRVTAPAVKANAARRLIDEQILAGAVEACDASFGDDPWIAGRLYRHIGVLYVNVGIADKGFEQSERAWRLLEQEVGPDHVESLKALSTLAEAMELKGDFEESARLLEQAVAGFRRALGEEDIITIQVIERLASSLLRLGRNDEAKKHLEFCAEARRRIAPDDVPGLAWTLENLANMATFSGHLDDARELLEEAVALRKSAQTGESDWKLPKTSLRLGAQLMVEGRLDEAEVLVMEGLAGLRRTLGDDHPRTMAAVNQLGSIHFSMGRDASAAELSAEVLESRRRVLGSRHPKTSEAMMNYAGSLLRLDRVEEAGELLLEAEKVLRETMGNTPQAALAIQNVGLWLGRVGRRQEATPRLREAARIMTRAYGTEHRVTLTAMCSLAVNLRLIGEYEEAQGILERVVAIHRRIADDPTPESLSALLDLSDVMRSRGRYAESIEVLREVVEGRRKLLGPNHYQTLQAVRNLGEYLTMLQRLEEAEPYCREALAGSERHRGPDHRDTVRAKRVMGEWFAASGDHEAAEALLREALDGSRRIDGPDHIRAITVLISLGSLLLSDDRADEAVSCYQEAFERFSRVLGERHMNTLIALRLLGVAVRSQADFERAETYIRQSLDGCREEFGSDNVRTYRALLELGEVFRLDGRFDEAEPLLRESVLGLRKTLGDEAPEAVKAQRVLELCLEKSRDTNFD